MVLDVKARDVVVVVVVVVWWFNVPFNSYGHSYMYGRSWREKWRLPFSLFRSVKRGFGGSEGVSVSFW